MVDFESEKARSIIQSIVALPHGKVSSYGAIAKRAGYPGLARYVAKVLSELPEQSTIPWHRVVNSQRKISFPKGSQAHEIQRQRLLTEGICFSNSDKISVEYFWE